MNVSHDLEKANRYNFRASLEALARPGENHFLEPVLGSGLLAMASMLLYGETTYFYRGAADFEIIRAACGATEAHEEEADFLFADSEDLDLLKKAKAGTSESPEFSATLLFGRDSLLLDETAVRMTGPGINGSRTMELPLSASFIERLQEKNGAFPIGVDLFLIGSDHSLIGLPRTTRIEVLP